MVGKYSIAEKKDLLNILLANTPEYFAKQELDDFSNYLDTHRDDYFVYREKEEIMGGSGCQYDDKEKTGSISWVLVRPDAHGKRLGWSLVKYCLDQLLKESGIKRVIVRTSQLAFKFFEKFGFQVVRTEKDYWGPGLDLYFMEMHVDGHSDQVVVIR